MHASDDPETHFGQTAQAHTRSRMQIETRSQTHSHMPHHFVCYCFKGGHKFLSVILSTRVGDVYSTAYRAQLK